MLIDPYPNGPSTTRNDTPCVSTARSAAQAAEAGRHLHPAHASGVDRGPKPPTSSSTCPACSLRRRTGGPSELRTRRCPLAWLRRDPTPIGHRNDAPGRAREEGFAVLKCAASLIKEGYSSLRQREITQFEHVDEVSQLFANLVFALAFNELTNECIPSGSASPITQGCAQVVRLAPSVCRIAQQPRANDASECLRSDPHGVDQCVTMSLGVGSGKRAYQDCRQGLAVEAQRVVYLDAFEAVLEAGKARGIPVRMGR